MSEAEGFFAVEARFSKRLEARVYNARYGLHFVKDDERYVCFNNCNHATVRWLRELGCGVTGAAGFSIFSVR